MLRRLVRGQALLQFIHLITDLLASGSSQASSSSNSHWVFSFIFSKFWVSCVGSVMKGANLCCRSPTSLRLVRENVSSSLSLLSPISHPCFLPDCMPSKFLSQHDMQKLQFYINCLTSSHNYCLYPCNNFLFLSFLVVLLLWSTLTDSERLAERELIVMLISDQEKKKKRLKAKNKETIV